MNSIKLRQILIAAAIMLVLLLVVSMGLLISDRKTRQGSVALQEEVQRDFRALGEDIDPAAIWIERSDAQFENLRRSGEGLQVELERLTDRLDHFEQSSTKFYKKQQEIEESLVLPEAAQHPALQDAMPPQLPAGVPTDTAVVAPVNSAPGLFPESLPGGAPPSVIAADVLVVEVSPPPQKVAAGASAETHADQQGLHVQEYIPSGTFVQGVLLTGLDAPTGGVAQTNPVPVLLSLSDQGRLPNRFQHRIRECFITAAGYGDLASERVYLRLERLSCVLHTGQTLDIGLQGYVAGEDGKAGLRGRVVSKQGSLIARSLLAGLAGGIGQGLSQSLTTLSTNALGSVQTIDSNQLLQYGVAQGAGTALEKVAQWYLARADEVYPIVEIGAGRTVEAVLTQGVRLHANLFESVSDEHPGGPS